MSTIEHEAKRDQDRLDAQNRRNATRQKAESDKAAALGQAAAAKEDENAALADIAAVKAVKPSVPKEASPAIDEAIAGVADEAVAGEPAKESVE